MGLIRERNFISIVSEHVKQKKKSCTDKKATSFFMQITRSIRLCQLVQQEAYQWNLVVLSLMNSEVIQIDPLLNVPLETPIRGGFVCSIVCLWVLKKL